MQWFQQWYYSSIVQSFLYELVVKGGSNNKWRGGTRRLQISSAAINAI